MSWRAVGVVYTVFAVLLAIVFLVDRPRDEAQKAAAESAPERSLLGVEPGAVRDVRFRRGGRRVHAERTTGGWTTLEPPGARVPPDLVDATVATLTAGQVSDVVADGTAPDDLATFGLDAPTSEIVLRIDAQGGVREVTVLVGERNPTRTALYARRADDPRVYLVGLNVRYYEDLIFEAAAGSP